MASLADIISLKIITMQIMPGRYILVFGKNMKNKHLGYPERIKALLFLILIEVSVMIIRFINKKYRYPKVKDKRKIKMQKSSAT